MDSDDSLKGAVSGHFHPGTRPAPRVVVIPLRARLSAIAIVATMLVTGAAPLFANEPSHRACLAHHHDRCKMARLNACCAEQGDRSDQATPASGKTQIAQPVADGTMVVTSATLARPSLLRHARAWTTAPRSSPPDLVTLFGTFLI